MPARTGVGANGFSELERRERRNPVAIFIKIRHCRATALIKAPARRIGAPAAVIRLAVSVRKSKRYYILRVLVESI